MLLQDLARTVRARQAEAEAAAGGTSMGGDDAVGAGGSPELSRLTFAEFDRRLDEQLRAGDRAEGEGGASGGAASGTADGSDRPTPRSIFGRKRRPSPTAGDGAAPAPAPAQVPAPAPAPSPAPASAPQPARPTPKARARRVKPSPARCARQRRLSIVSPCLGVCTHGDPLCPSSASSGAAR
jgi:hypothetical protein